MNNTLFRKFLVFIVMENDKTHIQSVICVFHFSHKFSLEIDWIKKRKASQIDKNLANNV